LKLKFIYLGKSMPMHKNVTHLKYYRTNTKQNNHNKLIDIGKYDPIVKQN